MLPVILGSSSKWRSSLLSNAGIAHTTMSPDIDEKATGDRENEDPSTVCLKVALAKQKHLVEKLENQPPCLLICSDQVVSYRNAIREKPTSKQECKEFLSSYYDDDPAETHTAVVVTNTRTGRTVQQVEVAKQYFTKVSETVIDALIEKGDIMHCSGGFLIDDDLITPYLSKRVGDEDSIIGMPLTLTRKLLEMASQD